MKKNIRYLALMLCVAMLIAVIPAVSMAAEVYTVTASWLRLRSGPSSSYAILGKYPTGTAVTRIDNQSVNGGWFHVTVGGKTGWMYSGWLKHSGSTSTVPASSSTSTSTSTTSPTLPASTTGDPVTRNNDTMRATVNAPVTVRGSASSGGAVINTLKTATTVSVLGYKNGYYYITTSSLSGYVPQKYLTLNYATNLTATVKVVSGGDYKLHAGSYNTSPTFSSVKAGAKVTVLYRGATWSLIKTGNVAGYIRTNMLSFK